MSKVKILQTGSYKQHQERYERPAEGLNRKERRAQKSRAKKTAPARARKLDAEIQRRKVRLPLVAETYHNLMDAAVARGMAEEKPPLTCTKGCSACCKQLLLMTYGEALLVTQKMPEQVAAAWPRIEVALVKADEVLQQEAFDPLEKPEELDAAAGRWWREQLDCPFLVDGLCSIYERRPNACRQHFALSPAERCANPDGNAEIIGWKAPALGEVIGRHWDAESQLHPTKQTIMGPLPHMMELARRTLERIAQESRGC